jgi:hypothetical protein
MSSADAPEKTEQAVNPIATSCCNCVFAEWFDNSQTGCQFDRLGKFEQNGGVIEKVDGGDRKYYVVYGRFCNTCRDHDWGQKHPRREWRKTVEYDIATRVSVIINAYHSTSLHDFAQSLESVLSQTHPATELVVALKGGVPSEYVNAVRAADSPIPWRVTDISVSPLPCYDEVVRSIKSTYYLVINGGHILPNNYLRTIDHAINREMMRFVVLLPDESGNRLLIQTSLHNLLKGNVEKPVWEKVIEIAGEEKTGFMVKRYGELPCV